MTGTPSSDHAERAYESLAPYYDEFTGHHDYGSWVDTLERLTRRHGLAGRRVLDTACGTGKSSLPFLARGYSVAGCDISGAMLDRARARLGDDVPLVRRDLRGLGEIGRFDLVCCIDDGLNYLLEPAEIVAALRGMAANLDEDGLVLFDVNTLATYRGFFAAPAVVESAEHMIVWQGRASAAFGSGELASATIDGYTLDGDRRWSRSRATHFQRHHPPGFIGDALAAAGLELVARYGQDLTGTVENRLVETHHTKVVYIARAVAHA